MSKQEGKLKKDGQTTNTNVLKQMQLQNCHFRCEPMYVCTYMLPI
jgi:hypothetical protein